MFAQKGYERTTVDDVAAGAGVSARTVFRYFPVKADLVFGDSEEDLEALRALFSNQDHSLPAFDIARVALAQFSTRIGNRTNAERSRVIAASPVLRARAFEIRELWAEAIAAEFAARRGLSEPDGQAWLAGRIVVDVLQSAVAEWSRDDASPDGLRTAVDRSAAWATEILQA